MTRDASDARLWDADSFSPQSFEERLLENAIGEATGAASPPDVTQRVMRRLKDAATSPQQSHEETAEERLLENAICESLGVQLPPDVADDVVVRLREDSFSPDVAEERLLDNAIRESLNVQTPPDVTPYVMECLDAAAADVTVVSVDDSTAVPLVTVAGATPRIDTGESSSRHVRRSHHRSARDAIVLLSVSAAAAVIAVFCTLYVTQKNGNVAERRPTVARPIDSDAVAVSPPRRVRHNSNLPNVSPGDFKEVENASNALASNALASGTGDSDQNPAAKKNPRNPANVAINGFADRDRGRSPGGILMTVPGDVPDSPMQQLLADGNDRTGEQHLAPLPRPQMDRDSDRRIVSAINQSLEKHWRRNRIRPTDQQQDVFVAARLESALGIRVDHRPSGPIREDTIIQALRDDAASHRIYAAWVNASALPGTDSGVIDQVSRQLHESIANGKPLDQTIADWYAGQASPAETSAWYKLLGGRRMDADRIVVSTSHAVMNFSASCIQCHNPTTPESGQTSIASVRQRDFHAFSQVFDGGLKHQRGTDQVEILDSIPGTKRASMFESEDGRMVSVAAELPSAFGLRSPRSAPNIRDFAVQLPGSRRLAAGTIDRMWKYVFGRPLVGDPDTTLPGDRSHLIQLREYLADQLIASDFDVVAATGWIAACDAMRLETPQVLRGSSFLLADNQSIRNAMHRLDAFAASAPPRPRPDRRRLGEMVAGWLAPSSATPGSLAQFAPTKDEPKDKRSRDRAQQDAAQAPTLTAAQINEEWLRMSMPRDDAGHPMNWLNRIESFDNAALHVAYVNGLDRLSDAEKQWLQQLRESGSTDAATLNRLDWVLKSTR